MGVIPASTTTRARMVLVPPTAVVVVAINVTVIVVTDIVVVVASPDSSTFYLPHQCCKHLVNIYSCLCTIVDLLFVDMSTRRKWTNIIGRLDHLTLIPKQTQTPTPTQNKPKKND